ncbi:MAG: hypothetical protein AABW67_00635 [Nanoarchaeota archaeon]
MDFKTTFKTITNSDVFLDFKKKYQNAELVAGFFILDFLNNNNNQKSLDYKKGENIYTFSINERKEISLTEDKLIEDNTKPPLTKISSDIIIDLDEIPSIAEQQAEKYNIKSKFQKIIAVLQIYDNKQVWNLTCILEGLIILNILIDSETEEIVKFDRKSMADFVRKA